MSDKIEETNEKLRFSNMLGESKIVFFSACVFLISSLFDWTRSTFMIYSGYFYLDIFTRRSGWPNLVPLTFLTTVVNIILCFWFMKPQTNERKATLRKAATIQMVLSILGLVAMLDLLRIVLVWNEKFLFGAWLGTLAVIGMVWGSIKARSYYR